MSIITIDKYNKEEEVFNYNCPPVLYSWGKMAGKEVSEAMLADIKKYYTEYFFLGNEPFYKNSVRVLKATLVEDEDNLMFDEVEVKLLYHGSIERRFLRLKDLYNF
jgi:hypothetical protein